MTDQDKKHLKQQLHEIIFEADTPSGKLFDIVLLGFIFASVLVVMLESVQSFNEKYHTLFITLEWIFTIFFTIEYILRLYSTLKPIKYATSFFGIIDLLAILPTYLSFFIIGAQHLMVIRALRLLRIFRIFKMWSFLRHAKLIAAALRASIPKIAIFLFFIMVLVVIFGSIMHLIEAGSNDQFDNIPRSIYWAIVTITTVGYGDIAPSTSLGQLLAAIIMLLGYAVIAVPTGIVTVELGKTESHDVSTQSCRYCSKEGHDPDAEYCKYCGEILNEPI